MNKTLRNPVTYLLFLLPTLLLYGIFYLYPVLNTVTYGSTLWDGVNKPIFIGLDNYIKALTRDDIFLTGLLNNIYFVLFSVFIQIPIIILLSILITEIRKFFGFYKTVVFLPSMLSTAVIGVLFSFVVFHPDIGLLNLILSNIGLESWMRTWLGDESTAFLSILVTNAWQWTGFYVVLVIAAILGIPREIYEAAEIDGASMFQKIRYITISLIRPVLMVIILLSITGAMKALDIVLVMTNGGPFNSTQVMATHMFQTAYMGADYGYANAIANLIFVFTIGITLIYNLITNKIGDVEN